MCRRKESVNYGISVLPQGKMKNTDEIFLNQDDETRFLRLLEESGRIF